MTKQLPQQLIDARKQDLRWKGKPRYAVAKDPETERQLNRLNIMMGEYSIPPVGTPEFNDYIQKNTDEFKTGINGMKPKDRNIVIGVYREAFSREKVSPILTP